MTRSEICKQYKVINGMIKNFGRYENEAVYTPYFWEDYVAGKRGVLNEFREVIIKVTSEDVAMFPELKEIMMVTLCEDNSQFVHCWAN